MRRLLPLLLIVASVAMAQEGRKEHPNYVPDERTAARIAEAVLVGQFGEKETSAQLPLLVDGSNKRYWIVQGRRNRDSGPSFGGGYGVWIDKHSGCIGMVVESMK